MTISPLWHAADVCSIFDIPLGAGQEAMTFHRLSIDSRSVNPGDLFFALKGESGDGHDYVKAALANGAVAAVVHRPCPEVAPTQLFQVGDTEHALRQLARAARSRCSGKLVAVTGSAGKTGVKEALRHVLSAQGPTVASPKSYNNHVGVPYSLAHLQADTQYGIFELGMNHAGEITPLSQLVRPSCVIITTIAPAHLQNFTSVEEIAQAKAEIFAGLDPEGLIILNVDNAYYNVLVNHAHSYGHQNILTFGSNPYAYGRLLTYEERDNKGYVHMQLGEASYTYHLPMLGYHHALNSVAVLMAVEAVGGNVVQAVNTLETLPSLRGRGSHHAVAFGTGSFLVIDESYNANPASMEASLRVLATMTPPPGGRRIAVLGEMRELGDQSPLLHQKLASVIKELPIDMVATCGPLMMNLAQALPDEQRGFHTETTAELRDLICALVLPGDIILVKGSRGMQTELIVNALLEMSQEADPKEYEGDAS